MTDQELKDIFKYKKFRLSTDNSIIYFELNRVFKKNEYIGDFVVKSNNGMYIMTFDPINLGPFQNIWVITENGDKILLNQLIPKLKVGETITLTQLHDEQVPTDIRMKLEEF